MRPKKLTAVLPLVLACVLPAGAAAAEETTTSLHAYGFVKVDAVYDFKRVLPGYRSTLRPSQIPVPGEDTPYYEEGELIFAVNASRVGVDIVRSGAGRDIAAKIEVDFYGTGANAGQLLPRLRHAHVVVGDFVVGQAWSLFTDTGHSTPQLDFWGACGTLFTRRPQLRWTALDADHRYLALALEQPGAGVDAGKGPQIDENFRAEPRARIPDVTAQYRLYGDWGHLQLAGVARELGYEGETTAGGFSGTEFGWGGYVSGITAVGDHDQVAASLFYGHGVANYANDGGVDLAGEDDGAARALPLLGWYLSWLRWWSPAWSTSVGASQTSQENSSGQLDDAFRTGSYAFVNLLRRVQPDLRYGVEVLWGERENKDGARNDDVRVQVGARLTF